MRLLLAAIVLLWPFAGTAQTRTWTFQEVLQQSLISHPSIQSRRASAQAAQSDVETAEWQRFPTPSLEAFGGGGDRAAGSTASRFRVQQPLWAGGRIMAGIEAAQSRKGAADSAVGESSQDIALRVVAAFVEAARQQARGEYSRRSVDEHKRLLELIGRRVQQEVSPPVDRELALSRLYQASNDLSSSDQALRSAFAQLMQLAGRPVERVAELRSDIAIAPRSQDQALELAITNSPTLARIAAEEKAAAADVDTRRAALWPQLNVRFERDFGGQLNDSRVLLVLEANPGAGLSAGSNVDAAVARQRSLQLARDSAVRDLNEQIAIDWNEFTFARGRLENAELARKTAAAVFDSFTRQYTAGRKTWVDVMNSVRESTQAELNATDITAQVAGAALRLAVLTGQIRLAAQP